MACFALALFFSLLAILLLYGSGSLGSAGASPQYIPADHTVCSIHRPGGQGTTINMSLAGNCTDDVWFRSAVSLNSTDIGTVTIDSSTLQKAGSFTLVEWTYLRRQGANVNILASLMNETIYSYSTSGISGYDIISGSWPHELSVEYLPFYNNSMEIGWRSENGTAYIHRDDCNMTNALFIAMTYNEPESSIAFWKNGEECGTPVIGMGLGNLSSALSLHAVSFERRTCSRLRCRLSAGDIRNYTRLGYTAPPHRSKTWSDGGR